MKNVLRPSAALAFSSAFSTVCSAAFSALIASAAHAEVAPRSAGYDARVQLVTYNALNVVRVVGSPTNSTQIIFGVGEEITQVSIGDEAAWLPQPVGNLLFLKPLTIKAPTNMQVVTRRADTSTSRSYQFRLVSARRGAMFSVSFNYPDDEEKARAALAAEKAASAKLADAWSQGPRNWRYVSQGSRLIEPAEVSDNGQQTAFRFPGNTRMPAIYTAAPDGSETIVAYAMVGDRAVVQTTSRAFTLREGTEVLRIINQGFDPVGRNPGTGTGLPDLSRIVRSPGP